MKQFLKILKFELSGYFKNKVFVGVTVFLMIAIGVGMCIPNITAAFKREEEEPETLPTMLVYSGDRDLALLVQESFQSAFPGYLVETVAGSQEEMKDRIVEGSAACAFAVDGISSYTYYVDNLSMYDVNTSIADNVLQQMYRLTAMVEGGMTLQQAGEILSQPIINQVVTLGKDQADNFFYTYIMIFVLYMVILLYGQMVATNVATEKSSRAMEVLITSAKPASMMFGKVLASCLAGLLQLVSVFGTALVFYQLNKSAWGNSAIVASIFNIPLELFGYMLVFFVLGFLIYAFLFGAIGSTASKLEDINTSVMPITLLFVIAFMVVVFSMSSGNVDNMAMKICSYIPFTSPMAMFTRICMSTVAWYEIAASVAILAVSVAAVGYLAAKIYRVGVLLYGTTPKIGSILKAVWRA